MAAAPALRGLAAGLAATGSFAAAGLAEQFKADAVALTSPPLTCLMGGDSGALVACGLNTARRVLGAAAQAALPTVAQCAALELASSVRPDVQALLDDRLWPLSPKAILQTLAKHLGMQLLMNINMYFAHVNALEEEAEAQDMQLAEWPLFLTPGVRRAMYRVTWNLTARETATKLFKYLLEDYLAVRLPANSMLATLTPAGTQVAAAATALGFPSRSLHKAVSLVKAAMSSCASTAWVFTVADLVVNTVADGLAALWRARWPDGALPDDAVQWQTTPGAKVAALGAWLQQRLSPWPAWAVGKLTDCVAGTVDDVMAAVVAVINGLRVGHLVLADALDVGEKAAWKLVPACAPYLLPLALTGARSDGPPAFVVVALGAAAFDAGLRTLLPADAYAAWLRAARINVLRCAGSLALGSAGAGVIALSLPSRVAAAYTACELVAWHLVVSPGVNAGNVPGVLAAIVAAGVVAVLHSLGAGGGR